MSQSAMRAQRKQQVRRNWGILRSIERQVQEHYSDAGEHRIEDWVAAASDVGYTVTPLTPDGDHMFYGVYNAEGPYEYIGALHVDAGTEPTLWRSLSADS